MAENLRGGLFAALAGLCLLAAPGAAAAQQGVFLEQTQALERALPDAAQVHRLSRLVPGRVLDAVSAASGVRLFPSWTQCFQGVRASQVSGYACIDNMIGKERPITYIVAIAHPAGTISMIEVMEYREAIGGEVRFPSFTRQLEGKGTADEVRLDRDVRRISGATLSSRALADGARKLLALYRLYLRELPPQ